MTTLYMCAFILTAGVSFVLTRLVRNRARSHGWTGQLSSHHIHEQPIPRIGGLAIFLSFIIGVGLIGLGQQLFHVALTGPKHRFIYILVAGLVVFLLGLRDDMRPLRAEVKFGVQALAALILYAGGFRILEIPLLFGARNLAWLSLPLTVLWVLWITNAFNLIDGLDGLAAGSALFSTLTVFVVSLTGGTSMVSLMTVALAGSILGFLKYNFNPATIFLGDCGSLFIGFMLSALALAGQQKTPTIVAVAIPVVSFGLPIFETVLSVSRRFLNGQPILRADRGHIHHRLLELGWSQRSAVVVLYGVSAACGLLSLLLLNPGGATVGAVLFVLGAGVWLAIQHLGYHEFFELSRVARRAMDQRRIISNNLAVRRAITRLASVEDYLGLCALLQETFESNDFDGFQLNLLARGVEYNADQELRLLSRDRGYHRSFTWHRTPAAEGGSELSPPAWSLSLELVDSESLCLGFLILYKSIAQGILGVDIGVLTSEFRNALTVTVGRLLARERPVAKEIPLGAPVSGRLQATP